MPNAIGTNQIGPSFAGELAAAGLSGLSVSWSSDGKFIFGPSVTSDQQIQVNTVFSAHNPTTSNLKIYSENARWQIECGGFTSTEGWKVATDRDSQTSMNGAAGAARSNSSLTTQWKFADGTFVTLSSAQVISMQSQAQSFIAQCFAVEANVDSGVDAGTITTTAQIDSAYQSLKNQNIPMIAKASMMGL